MEVQRLPHQAYGLHNYPATSSFNMTSMSNNLPDYQARNFSQPAYQQQFMPQSHPSHAYQVNQQQNLQFASQPGTQYQMQFPPQYQAQYSQQHYRPPSNPSPAFQQGFAPTQQMYAQQFTMPAQSSVQGAQNMSNRFYQQSNVSSQPATFGMQATGGYGAPIRFESTFVPVGSLSVPQPSYQSKFGNARLMALLDVRTDLSRHSSDSSLRLTVPRGPPRKPKQSGHALWVGNLPPGTNVLDLKDHFSRDAVEDIESVFLISKSNCAFVNYKSEESCAAAMSRFHDSRFHGVRLVCRLRRGSSSTSTTAPSPGGQDSTAAATADPQSLSARAATSPEEAGQQQQTAMVEEIQEPEPIERVPEKFFIVKSLTMEDLELSAQNGIWATQAHNENALNRAYQVRVLSPLESNTIDSISDFRECLSCIFSQ